MKMKIKGLDVDYEINGSGNNILILHGWGSSKEVHRDMINSLSKHNKVYALDFPGFGKSEEPKTGWNVDDYVELIIKFIEKNNIKKLSLIGHSFGGRVIIKLFTKKIDFEIDKVVLIDSAGIKSKVSKKSSLKSKFVKIFTKIFVNKFTKKIFPSLINKIKGMIGSVDYRSATPVMRETLVKVVNEDLEPYIGKINVSTLLIWGEIDKATPLSDAYKMERLIKDSGLVVLKGRGHYSFLEEKERVNKILDSFFGGK